MCREGKGGVLKLSAVDKRSESKDDIVTLVILNGKPRWDLQPAFYITKFVPNNYRKKEVSSKEDQAQTVQTSHQR